MKKLFLLLLSFSLLAACSQNTDKKETQNNGEEKQGFFDWIKGLFNK